MSPNGRAGPRQMNNGYYSRNNSYGFRNDQYQEDGPRSAHMRHQSQQQYNMQNGDSPNSYHSHQPSYETMTSGSDEMSKSTNPSSQNSSFDQLHQANIKRQQDNGYEGSPYRGYDRNGGPMRNPYPPSAMPNGYSNQYSGETDDYGMVQPVPPARRAPIKLGGESTGEDAWNGDRLKKVYSPPQRDEKRKSWIKRTFSKKS